MVLNEWLQAVARQLGYQPEPRVWDPNTQPSRADNAGLGVGQQIAPIMALPEAGILPPGWYVDSGGALRVTAWDTPNARESVSQDSPAGNLSTTNLGAMLRIVRSSYVEPWTAEGIEPAQSASIAGGWKTFYVARALVAGSATDVSLIAAVAGRRFDVRVCGMEVVPVDGTAALTIVATFQDSADTAVVGMLTTRVSYKYDVTNSRFAGYLAAHYNDNGAAFVTPTVALALEVDITGGAGAEVVVIWGRYREVVA